MKKFNCCWLGYNADVDVAMTPEGNSVSMGASYDAEAGFVLDGFNEVVESLNEDHFVLPPSNSAAHGMVTTQELRIQSLSTSRSPSPLDGVCNFMRAPLPATKDEAERLQDELEEKSTIMSFMYRNEFAVALKELPTQNPVLQPPAQSAFIAIKRQDAPKRTANPTIIVEHCAEVTNENLALLTGDMSAKSLANPRHQDAKILAANMAMRIERAHAKQFTVALSAQTEKAKEIAALKARVQPNVLEAKNRRLQKPHKVRFFGVSPCFRKISPASTPDSSPELRPLLV